MIRGALRSAHIVSMPIDALRETLFQSVLRREPRFMRQSHGF